MLGIVLAVLTVLLVFVSLFLILVVLAQKSKDGGMGAAFGGGAAEAAFGAETNTVLTKSTIYSAILFFLLAFIVYLGRIYERGHARTEAGSALPNITVPATPPATKSAPVSLPPLGASAPATNATKPAPAVSSEPIATPAQAATTGSAASSTQPSAPATKKP